MDTFGSGGRLPLLLTPQETADALRLTLDQLWRLTGSGKLPCVRIGRAARYIADDVRAWIREHRTNTPDRKPA